MDAAIAVTRPPVGLAPAPAGRSTQQGLGWFGPSSLHFNKKQSSTACGIFQGLARPWARWLFLRPTLKPLQHRGFSGC